MCMAIPSLKKCGWEAVVKLLFVLWKSSCIKALVRRAPKGPCVFKAWYMTIRPGISRSTFLWGKLGELKGLHNSSVGTQSIYRSSHNCLWDKTKPCFGLSFLQEKNPMVFWQLYVCFVMFFPHEEGVFVIATPSSARTVLRSSSGRPHSVKKYQSPMPLRVCKLLISRRWSQLWNLTAFLTWPTGQASQKVSGIASELKEVDF